MPTSARFRQYADLAIHVGLNVQPGQRVVISAFGAPAEMAPLIHAAAASAYDAGARLVDVVWNDGELMRIRLEHADPETFTEFPDWRVAGMVGYAEAGDAMLSIAGQDPGYLEGQNPEHVALLRRVGAQHSRPYQDAMALGHATWCVIGAAGAGWANKVFPDLPEDERVERLWESLFSICRLDQPDPVAAWRTHAAQLIARHEYLTSRQFSAVHFRGPGTDLTVGLPANHQWQGGGATSTAGIVYTPNMPTEEVFTLPHRDRVDGTVRASLPLNLSGTLIDGFSLTFKEGRVVAASAEKGEIALQRLLETDDGARRLGEVALVPASSPIAQTGRLFYNTLYDENAASHIALGRAYRINFPNGETMSQEEFVAAGANHSLIHVDFMIGSDQMDVDAVSADGSREPLMRAGEWAIE